MIASAKKNGTESSHIAIFALRVGAFFLKAAFAALDVVRVEAVGVSGIRRAIALLLRPFARLSRRSVVMRAMKAMSKRRFLSSIQATKETAAIKTKIELFFFCCKNQQVRASAMMIQ